MSRKTYSGQIKAKGWLVKSALKFWSRSQDWYARNSNGDKGQQVRLQCMIDGLPDRAYGGAVSIEVMGKQQSIESTEITKGEIAVMIKDAAQKLPICNQCQKHHDTTQPGIIMCGCGNTFEWGEK